MAHPRGAALIALKPESYFGLTQFKDAPQWNDSLCRIAEGARR
jgi:hypothetical protein